MYFCTLSKRVFIVACEMSGDADGALLIEQLRSLMPDCIIEGLGGPAMQAQGMQSMAPFSVLNVSGFWEVVVKYRELNALLQYCKQTLSANSYDAFIAVDYPGFNMRLGHHAKSIGIPSICYIAPQLWAWGKSRMQNVKKSYDILLTVLPFEEAFFQDFGIKAPFVGHPLLDRPQFKDINPNRDPSLICMMPGSRKQEVLHHLPILLPIAESLSENGYKPVFCIPEHLRDLFNKADAHRFTITSSSSETMQNARAGCVKMGTSTLEAALYGMPFISYYATSFISYMISKRKVTLPWISLPNILLNRSLIPEFIQQQAQSNVILPEILKVIEDNDYRTKQIQGFTEIRNMLGGPGASLKAASIIADIVCNGTNS